MHFLPVRDQIGNVNERNSEEKNQRVRRCVVETDNNQIAEGKTIKKGSYPGKSEGRDFLEKEKMNSNKSKIKKEG